MGYGAISGNAGGDSIKCGSTEEAPHTQHNGLCSDFHYAVTGHESQWKGPHNSFDFPEMLSINYFCNPWLCFNYVSACFESSAHWGAVLFQDEEIEMNFPTRFTFLGISSEFHNLVVCDLRFSPFSSLNNKKRFPWIITPRSETVDRGGAASRPERCLQKAKRGMWGKKNKKKKNDLIHRAESPRGASVRRL